MEYPTIAWDKIRLLVIIGALAAFSFTAWQVRRFIHIQSNPDTFLAPDILNKRDTPEDVAEAFTLALRMNLDLVYELTDPALHLRLDEWMSRHTPQHCISWGNDVLGGLWLFGSHPNDSDTWDFDGDFLCYLEGDTCYTFKVNHMIVRDTTIMDWGEIEEIVGGRDC